MAIVVSLHCDVISCKLLWRRSTCGSSTCGRGNVVGLTSLVWKWQFFYDTIREATSIALKSYISQLNLPHCLSLCIFKLHLGVTYYCSVSDGARKRQLVRLQRVFAVQDKAEALSTAVVDGQLLHQQRLSWLHALRHITLSLTLSTPHSQSHYSSTINFSFSFYYTLVRIFISFSFSFLHQW